MNAMPVRVAVFGDVMIDYSVEIDSRAARDEKRAVTASNRSLGGSGANAAAAVTRICGPASADLFATVSDDSWGEWIVDRVRGLDIGVEHVRRIAGAVPHAVIVHDGGDRSLLVDRGVADDIVVPPATVLAPYQVVYVSNPIACLTPLVVPAGSSVVAGVEHQMVDGLDATALARVDLVVTNAAGWDLLRHRRIHVPVVATDGARGVTVYRPDDTAHHFAAHDVDVRDATGAGDVFAGALCAYLAGGLDLTVAVGRANAVASIAVTTAGAQLGPVDPELVNRRYRQIHESGDTP